MACLSGILMSALITSLVLADFWFWHTRRVIPHVFLGGIAIALFFTLCQRGYEYVNWALLGLVALSLLVPLFKELFVWHDDSDDESYDSSSCTQEISICDQELPVVRPNKPRCPERVLPVATCNSSKEATGARKFWYENKYTS